jgi:hypothetical protein
MTATFADVGYVNYLAHLGPKRIRVALRPSDALLRCKNEKVNIELCDQFI